MSCLCFCWPRRRRPSTHHAERAGSEPQAVVTELKTKKKKKKWSFKRFLGLFRKKNKVGVEVPHQDQAEEGKVLQPAVEAADGVELPGVPERTSSENATPEAEGLEEIINISSSTVKLLEKGLVIIDLEREEDTTEKISRNMDAVEAEVAAEMIQDVSDAQADASELPIVDLKDSQEATEKPLDGRDGDDGALEELVNIDPVERDGDTGRFDKNEDLISRDPDTNENTWISRVNGPEEAERAAQKTRHGRNEIAFLQLLMCESIQTTEKVLDKEEMIIIDLEKPEDTTQKGLISSNIDTGKAEMMMEKLLITDPQERMKVNVKEDEALNKLMKTDQTKNKKIFIQSKLEIIEIDDFEDNMETPLDVEDVDAEAEAVKNSSIIDLKKAEDTSKKILISRDMVSVEAKVAMKKVWQISEAHDDAFKELLITDLEENEEETTETPQIVDVRAAEVEKEASEKKNNKEETKMLDLDVKKFDVVKSPKNVVPDSNEAKSRRPAGSPMDDDALAEILKRQVKKLKRVRFILPIENGMSAGDLFHDIKFPSTKKEDL